MKWIQHKQPPLLTHPLRLTASLLTAICTMLPGCTAVTPNSQSQTSWQTDIAAAAQTELDSSGTASLQIAIGYRGELVYEGAFGFADLQHKVPATSLTRYRTASVSKWFTATAAMRLIEQGQLKPNADIRRYCSAYPQHSPKITTQQLLTHTAGVRHYVDYEAAIAAANTGPQRRELRARQSQSRLSSYTRYASIDPTLNSFINDPLQFEPGTDWLYSSFGYRLLACVLEGAAQQPYRQLMKQQIFKPTGMQQTSEDDAWEIVANRAAGYRLSRNKELRRADLRDVSENLPAGGHLSTASDLIRFASAFDQNQLTSAAVKNLMYIRFTAQPDTYSEPSWQHAIPAATRYGVGVMCFPSAQGCRPGHSGRQAGGSAIVMIIPRQELSIAVMTNAKGWNGFMSFTSVLQAIAQQGIVD